MSRPKKEFNWDIFEALCALPQNFSQETIAFVMQVSVDTMQRHIKEEYGDINFKEFREKTKETISESFKAKLMAKQFQRAMSGSDRMLIHLGQNYLGQKQQVEMDVSETNFTLNYSLDDKPKAEPPRDVTPLPEGKE